MPRKLRKRVYTYGQLDTILHRRGEWGSPLDTLYSRPRATKFYARLYGNLHITCDHSPAILIEYLTNRTAGKWRLAEVRLLANGDTGYLLPTHSQDVGLRHMSGRGKQKWKRIAAAFTPYEPDHPTGKWGRCMYRVRPNGEVISLGVDAAWPHYFMSYPKSIVPKPDRWVEVAGVRELHMPNYERRLKLFATMLRKALADGPRADMQLTLYGHGCSWFASGHDMGKGAAALRVALPPRENAPAKLLWVFAYYHTAESRHHFHIDGDFAMAHTQFAAAEGEPHDTTFYSPKWYVKRWHVQGFRPLGDTVQRWKCASDAVIGVKEWVMSQLYIPGI